MNNFVGAIKIVNAKPSLFLPGYYVIRITGHGLALAEKFPPRFL